MPYLLCWSLGVSRLGRWAASACSELAADQLALFDRHDHRVYANVGQRAVKHWLKRFAVVDCIVSNKKTTTDQTGPDQLVNVAVYLLLGVKETEGDITHRREVLPRVTMDQVDDVIHLRRTKRIPREGNLVI